MAVERGVDIRDLTAMDAFLAGWSTPRPDATMADVVAHLEHAREVVGIDHLGLGGDYDGVEVVPVDLADVAAYPRLLDALAERGWSDADLAKLAHGNIARVLRAGEEVAARIGRARRRCSGRGAGVTGDGTPMSGLLEVVVLHAADAERAEAGGADRLCLVGSLDREGRSPEPSLVGQVVRATSLPVRVLLRLRDGYGTDGGEVARLRGLLTDVARSGPRAW